jgi:hypothetical protein
MVDAYHDEVVLHWFGRNPLAGVHAGKAAALTALAASSQRAARRLISVDQILAQDDRALLVVRERFERDGRSAEMTRLLYYRVARAACESAGSTTPISGWWTTF